MEVLNQFKENQALKNNLAKNGFASFHIQNEEQKQKRDKKLYGSCYPTQWEPSFKK